MNGLSCMNCIHCQAFLYTSAEIESKVCVSCKVKEMFRSKICHQCRVNDLTLPTELFNGRCFRCLIGNIWKEIEEAPDTMTESDFESHGWGRLMLDDERVSPDKFTITKGDICFTVGPETLEFYSLSTEKLIVIPCKNRFCGFASAMALMVVQE